MPDISEEEAIAIAMANSELNQLTMWDSLTVQLRESSLAYGRPANPPATPTRMNARAPSDALSTAWDPWPPSPQTALPPPPPAYQLPWRMPEIIDLVSDDEQ
jgi:hypothetical protein